MPLLGGLVNATDQNIGGESGDNSNDAQPDGRAPLVHGRGLLLVLLGLKEIGVSAELEDKVSEVSKEEQNGGSAGKREQAGKRGVVRWSRFTSSIEPTAGLVRKVICSELGGVIYTHKRRE